MEVLTRLHAEGLDCRALLAGVSEPLPRDPANLRVALPYAQLTALLTTLSLGPCDYRVYLRRTGLTSLSYHGPGDDRAAE